MVLTEQTLNAVSDLPTVDDDVMILFSRVGFMSCSSLYIIKHFLCDFLAMPSLLLFTASYLEIRSQIRIAKGGGGRTVHCRRPSRPRSASRRRQRRRCLQQRGEREEGSGEDDALTFTYHTKQLGSDLSATLNDIWIF